MNSEIGAKTLTSTGTIQSGRTRLLSIYYVGHASAGTLTFKDGGGSGTQKLVITTPAGSAADQYQINMPLDGILFKTDIAKGPVALTTAFDFKTSPLFKKIDQLSSPLTVLIIFVFV